MKKSLNKLRIWIIHKLGGVYPPDVRVVKTYTQKPIRICFKKTFSRQLAFRGSLSTRTEELAKKYIALKLAEELIKNGNICDISFSELPEIDAFDVRAEIFVYERSKV